MGFWVATTTNGRGTRYTVASVVTVRSCMTSRRADWVLGDARFISSPSTMLANTGPGRKVNLEVDWSKTATPVTSVGSRSGVNWMRFQVRATDIAMARA